jgi:hypothetical protein
LLSNWSDWFNGFRLQEGVDERGPFVALSGFVPDQAALQGVLAKLASLNLQLLGVELIDSSEET